MTDQPIPAYAIAYLRDVTFNADIIRYMREIDGTLTPFGGTFVVHGGRKHPIEGEWDGDIVIIRFPDYAAAHGWYESAEYQRILPLRVESSSSIAVIVEGVESGHTGTSMVDKMLNHTDLV
ncbi:MAG: DUF1330 domain-containing protein [Mycobacterium sp.]